MISFDGKKLTIVNKAFVLGQLIMDARRIGDRIIVLLDPDEGVLAKAPYDNLICLGLDGEQIWAAEYPTDAPDYYFQITHDGPLIAHCFRSFACEIDVQSGKIISREFYK